MVDKCLNLSVELTGRYRPYAPQAMVVSKDELLFAEILTTAG